RLELLKLDQLADRQQQLADKAADLAAKDPIKDASAKPLADKLQREQGEVANELRQLTDQSEPLRQAMDADRGREAKELAEKARQLAKEERDLAKTDQQ